MSNKLPRLKIKDKRHKEISDKYDHYVCEICMGFGVQEVIPKFVEKLRKYLGCETCTSSGKPKTCKSCCDLYSIIEEYEAMVK